MLVLTRKIGETIVIGGNITVTILDGGRGEGVRIGIDAPREVSIHRSEVVEAVSASNREAVDGSAGEPGAESPEQLILAALGLAGEVSADLEAGDSEAGEFGARVVPISPTEP